jgi:MOSC domain-containing protein YiiM
VNDLRELVGRFPSVGRVEAVLLRPARSADVLRPTESRAIEGRGLEGDRATAARAGGKRQVTLVQAEHLPAVAALLRRASLDPALLRRNLVVSGINLLGVRSPFADRVVHLQVGDAVLEITGPCEPCSKLEAALGPGAYNALRGHGGVTARVLRSGRIAVGDAVRAEMAARG